MKRQLDLTGTATKLSNVDVLFSSLKKKLPLSKSAVVLF